ncbi:hypothetical protein SAMN05421770_101498 [Granulicella rosea]|uniref:NHL repeat containing protein n=1 Tax=Granulicella rosea TaxID=474952 RepID=A0A239DJ06_9BACT|nr:hypothetical protein [Granulicella rosea]SNS32377.1 hypothetical protein SAMN05421770_101498 [Granulicella rosea]
MPLPRRACLLVASSFLATLLAGCSLSPTGEPVETAGVALTGVVHGGQQPIVGAKLYLLAAGTGGYGTASTSLLTTGVAGTDSIGGYVLTTSGGSFSITGDYTCTPGTQVYLYSLGGNGGAGANASSGLLAALGNCPSSGSLLSTTPFILINEVTTVAAAYALAGFATDATHISSSGSTLAQTGVKNAFLTAANLANVATGAAPAQTVTGTGAVPQSEIYTLANILASCVNSASPFANCTTLFANAKSAGSTGTAPTDTATAAINIAHNPGQNIANLYGLAGGTAAPFQPTLSTAPNDFSVSIVYSDNGGNIAIDGSGNLWEATYGGVLARSSNGTLLSPAAGYGGGGISSTFSSNAIAIDPSNNVWVVGANSCGGVATLVKLSNAGTILSGSSGYTGNGMTGQANGIAIDGSGDVFVSNDLYTGSPCSGSSSALPGSISRFTNAGAVYGSPLSGSGVGQYVNGLAFDNTGALWTSSYNVTENSNNSYTTTTLLDKFTTAGAPVTGAPFTGGGGPIAIDSVNDVFGAGTGPVYENLASGAAAPNSPFTNSHTNTALSQCIGMAVDGANNVWCASDNDSIAEMTNTGTPISPDAGYVTPNALGPTGIAIDGSGNVWVSNGYMSVGNSVAGIMWEMVGGAAPVVTPLSAAVKAGTLGQRP